MTTYPWKQEPFHQFCVVFLQHYKHSASHTYNFGTFHLIAITLIYFFVLYIIFYFAQMHNHSISLYNSVRFVFKHSVPPPVCHSSFFLLFAAGDSADTRVVVLFCFACLLVCFFLYVTVWCFLALCHTLQPLSAGVSPHSVSFTAQCRVRWLILQCERRELLSVFSAALASLLVSLTVLPVVSLAPAPPSVSVYEALSRSSALSHVDVDGQEE